MKWILLATLSAVLVDASFVRGGQPETLAAGKGQVKQPCREIDASLDQLRFPKEREIAPEPLAFKSRRPEVAAPASDYLETPSQEQEVDQCLLDAPPCTCAAAQWRKPGSLWFGGADYLLWWFKDSPSPPPMVVSGQMLAASQPQLGQQGAQTVLGGSPISPGTHSGGRFWLGRWLDCDRRLGIQGGFFFLGNRTVTQSVAASGAPGSNALLLPFFDPTQQAENTTWIAQPGAFSGSATLATASRLQGWEVNAVLRRDTGRRFNPQWLVGAAYFNLTENLLFATSSPNIVPPPDVFTTYDNFHTRNNFYGAQVGLRGTLGRGRWRLEGTSKLAMGNMRERVNVGGATITNAFNQTGDLQHFAGGYFAQPTNIGATSRDRFVVIPQTYLNLTYQLTCRLRARFGYSFLYVSSVARPANQMDRVINPTQAPSITGEPTQNLIGAARPMPVLHGSDFWAQGLNFGLELAY